MAAKYRKIDPRIWTDESFAQLDSTEKLVALYAITSQSNRCGLFRFSPGRAAEETALDADSYATAFAKVCDRLRWKYDQKRRVLYLPTWWKYNPPENPKHLHGCLDDLHDLPQTTLLKDFAANDRFIPDHSKPEFSIAMQIAMANQEQKQELEQEQKKDSAGAEPPAAASKRSQRKEPTGPHHAFIRHFCTRWQAKYGVPYAFNAGKDGQHVQKILTWVIGEIDEAMKVADRFLDDADPFVADKKHPLGLLVSNFNKYRVGSLFTTPAKESHERKPGQFTGARRSVPEVRSSVA